MKATAPVQSGPSPQAGVSTRWIGLFGFAWLGIWLAQLTPFQLLLPQQIDNWLGLGTTLRADNWQHSVTDFGVISGISAACALIAFPLSGALSDRTTGRFGRRRPWIAGGVALFAVALLVLSGRHTYAGMAVCWCLAITGFAVASAALTAMISDQVPVRQRGVVSSWVSAPQAVGVIIGIALISALGLGQVAGYGLTAVLLVVCATPLLWLIPDPPAATAARSRQTVLGLLRVPDFRWTLLGRVLVNIGNALGTSLLLFYLQFGLEVRDPDNSLLVLTAIYMVFVIGMSIGGGIVSDRIGRRKPFVLVAGLLQGLAAAVIVIFASQPAAMVGAALLGAGFGCFMSIDQALATEVLPGVDHNGKDLGVMNIAMAVPQALGPLLGAWIVELTGGFPALFVVSTVFGLLGAISVLRVKGVR